MGRAGRMAGPDAVQPLGLGAGGSVEKASLSKLVWYLWASP